MGKPYYIANGEVEINGKKMWRVDDVNSGKIGMEMINNPVALVESFELAHLISHLLNDLEDVEIPQKFNLPGKKK